MSNFGPKHLGCMLLVVFLPCFALAGRIDSPEVPLFRVLDVIFGLIVAAAFFGQDILRDKSDGNKRRSRLIFAGILIWVLISGPLLTYHELIRQMRQRSPRDIAANLVKEVQIALYDYEKDCGSFPSEQQGLRALYENPGLAKWAGPYMNLPPIDPWGQPLLYRVEKNRIEVRSSGRDKQIDTADDIVQEISLQKVESK